MPAKLVGPFDDVRQVLRLSRARRASEPPPPPPMPSSGPQRDLELGGAAARLRAKGFPWEDVADALGVASVARLRALAGQYLLWLGSQADGEPAGDAHAASAADASPDAERVTAELR